MVTTKTRKTKVMCAASEHTADEKNINVTAAGARKVKKGKADHARMGVGGVLISLTLVVSP